MKAKTIVVIGNDPKRVSFFQMLCEAEGHRVVVVRNQANEISQALHVGPDALLLVGEGPLDAPADPALRRLPLIEAPLDAAAEPQTDLHLRTVGKIKPSSLLDLLAALIR